MTEGYRKYELILLSVLVLILGSILLVRTGRICRAESLPDWELPGLSDLERVLIENPVGTEKLVLEKREERWFLPQLNRYGGDQEADEFLSSFQNLQPVNSLSPKGPYSPYGLKEDQAVRIHLIQKGKDTSFFVGNLNETGAYTYFRKEGDPAVYSVRGDWRRILGINPEELRSPRIFYLDPILIQGLTFLQGDRLTILEKKGDQWFSSGIPAEDQQRIQYYVKRLSRLNCQSFLENPPSTAAPLLKVQITTDSETYTLDLFENDSRGYPARSGGMADAFLLNNFDGDTLMDLSGF